MTTRTRLLQSGRICRLELKFLFNALLNAPLNELRIIGKAVVREERLALELSRIRVQSHTPDPPPRSSFAADPAHHELTGNISDHTEVISAILTDTAQR
ncbi:MAG: hypothetical protein OSB12_05110 [Planctomycetota bacterium]|nr:hypothetical protein [Planctomycetota bacterium]